MTENDGDAGRVPLFEGYSLDLVRGSLLRDGTPVHLRPLAFDLLRYLCANRGRLVSKDTLVEHVWQGRAVSDDSIVQCLRDVRLALGPAGNRYLRNVRGRGYILEAPAALSVDAAAPSDSLEVIRVVVDDDRPIFTRRLAAAVGALILGVLAIGAGVWRIGRTPAGGPIQSIAVLPFAVDSVSRDAEYVTDGIAETLVNDLARVSGLAVKARGSVFRYRGSRDDPQRIGRDLQVDGLVTGRLAQRGDDLTLYISLVDTRTGNQVWGDEFHGRASDLGALSQGTARDIAGRLRAGLARESMPPAERMPAPQAYSLYLRGQYEVRKRTKPGILDGIALYQQALAIDPDYAAAHAALADAYRVLPIAYGAAPVEAFPLAKTSAGRAIALDPGLANPHVVLGWISFWFDWDWPGAEEHLSKALALDPYSSRAYLAYGHLMSNLGRHGEAIAAMRRALELDPVDPTIHALQGQFLMYAGRLDEAEAAHRAAFELQPDFWIALNGIGRVRILRGQLREAIDVLEKAASRSEDSPEPLTQLGYALARAHRADAAHRTLARLADLSADGYVPAYDVAMIRHGLGDDETALSELERAASQREVQLTFLKVDTRWDDLRSNPRFAAIVRQMKLE